MVSITVFVTFVVSTLFTCGMLGNSYVVLTTGYYLWRKIRRRRNNRDVVENDTDNNDCLHVLIYVIARALIDFGTLTCCPFIFYYINSESWELGSLACILYWFLEQAGNKYSVCMLAWISFDRYIWLKRKNMCRKIFNIRSALLISCLMFFIVALIVFPVLIYVDVFPVIVQHGKNNNTTTSSVMIAQVCLFEISSAENLANAYLIYSAVFTFTLPTSVMCLSVCVSLAYLYVTSDSASADLGYSDYKCEKQISVCLSINVAYCILCTAPNCIMNLLIRFSDLFETQANNETFLMFVLHLLPYVHAAGNWMCGAIMKRIIISRIEQRDQERRESIRRIRRRSAVIGGEQQHMQVQQRLQDHQQQQQGIRLAQLWRQIRESAESSASGGLMVISEEEETAV